MYATLWSYKTTNTAYLVHRSVLYGRCSHLRLTARSDEFGNLALLAVVVQVFETDEVMLGVRFVPQSAVSRSVGLGWSELGFDGELWSMRHLPQHVTIWDKEISAINCSNYIVDLPVHSAWHLVQ